MLLGRPADSAWAWYASRTPDCAPLDGSAYPSAEFNGQPLPWPEWACRAPDGGVHIDARTTRIDVHLAEPPKSGLQLTWTCSFGVRLVSRDWLTLILDLLEARQTALGDVFPGDVFVGSERLEEWATLHGRLAPPLLSTEAQTKVCPVCGDVYSVQRGKPYFADPAARSMPLIVNRNGVFVRKDLLQGRSIPTPTGAFAPRWVRLEDKHH